MHKSIELVGKDPSADPESLTNREKTLLVEALRPAHKLKDLLDTVALARSSYRYQVRAMAAPDKYAALRVRIREMFTDAHERYGYRRIKAVLEREGTAVSEKVIIALMADEGLVAKRGKKRRWRSYAGETSKAPANLHKRDFHANEPNRVWVTDVTEFSIPAGKVYLSAMRDCFDGFIVAATMSQSPDAELANTMLEQALDQLPGDAPKPVVHSDRGGHYRWKEWIRICTQQGVIRSMSTKGCTPDNAAAEGFFGNLKVEFFHDEDWDDVSIEEFMDRLADYIEWYNTERIKMGLGAMSPLEYRRSLGLVS